jgi:hypothetical protein
MGKFYRIMLCLLYLIPQCAWSQKEDCEQTIAQATEEFNAGHFYSISAILNECMKSFSREQRQRAFLLLTQTYLLLDDPIGAQKSFLEVLTANPEFIPDEQLHAIDIVYLSKRFTATPKFSWFVGGGSNISPVRVIWNSNPTPVPGANEIKETYKLRAGYNFGVGGEYGYNDNVKLRLGIDYLYTTYSAFSVYFKNDTKALIDRQTWVNIPLYVCYSDNIGKYRPYGYAGYALSMLLGDRGSIKIENVTGEGDGKNKIDGQSPEYDFTNRRNKLNQSIIFGGGIKYKVGLDFVFVDLRYSFGLKNIVNPDQVYGDYTTDQTSDKFISSLNPLAYAHVDDYFRLDNLSITFGFLRPLYKPRELKRARTKGVLRKMKKSE